VVFEGWNVNELLTSPAHSRFKALIFPISVYEKKNPLDPTTTLLLRLPSSSLHFQAKLSLSLSPPRIDA